MHHSAKLNETQHYVVSDKQMLRSVEKLQIPVNEQWIFH